MVEVAAALAFMSGYRSIQKKIRSQAFDEEAPPTSLLSIYLRNHNTYPILVLLFVPPTKKKQSRHSHIDQVLVMIPLMLSMNRT